VIGSIRRYCLDHIVVLNGHYAIVVQAMRHRLQTREGKAVYAERKSTVETVFGIIKHVLEFRQFLLRGLDSVQGEWSLVCIGWNLKRMHTLRGDKLIRMLLPFENKRRFSLCSRKEHDFSLGALGGLRFDAKSDRLLERV
jgi:hypothetical protein